MNRRYDLHFRYTKFEFDTGRGNGVQRTLVVVQALGARFRILSK